MRADKKPAAHFPLLLLLVMVPPAEGLKRIKEHLLALLSAPFVNRGPGLVRHQQSTNQWCLAQRAGELTTSIVVVIVVVGASTVVVVVVGYCTCQTRNQHQRIAAQRRHNQSGQGLEHTEDMDCRAHVSHVQRNVQRVSIRAAAVYSLPCSYQ